jgi:hypothetical protein
MSYGVRGVGEGAWVCVQGGGHCVASISVVDTCWCHLLVLIAGCCSPDQGAVGLGLCLQPHQDDQRAPRGFPCKSVQRAQP